MSKDIETLSSILSYVDFNPIATVGTINSNGTPHGAIVYLCADNYKPVVYFLTKTETTKFRNLNARNQVSLTITNPSENSTLQANGTAQEVQDPKLVDSAMTKLTKLHVNAAEWLPPISKIRAGAYVLVAVTLQNARLAQFKGMSIGDEHIFTQI